MLSACPKQPETALQQMALRRFARGDPPPEQDFHRVRRVKRAAELADELFVIGLDDDGECLPTGGKRHRRNFVDEDVGPAEGLPVKKKSRNA